MCSADHESPYSKRAKNWLEEVTQYEAASQSKKIAQSSSPGLRYTQDVRSRIKVVDQFPKEDPRGNPSIRSHPPGLVKRFVRAIALRTLVGFTAGLAGGLGARIVMRIIAMVAGPSALGAVTQNGNIVGQITPVGTFELVFVGAFTGVSLGILFMAIRPWLVWSGHWKGLLFGVVLFSIFGSLVISNLNPDFIRFGLPGLNVLLFSLLPIIFGLLAGVLVDRLGRFFPFPSRQFKTLVAYGLLVIPFFFGAFLFLVAFLLEGPFYLGLIVIIVFAYLVLVRVQKNQYANSIGYVLIGVSGFVGLVLDIQAIAQIVRA